MYAHTYVMPYTVMGDIQKAFHYTVPPLSGTNLWDLVQIIN